MNFPRSTIEEHEYDPNIVSQLSTTGSCIVIRLPQFFLWPYVLLPLRMVIGQEQSGQERGKGLQRASNLSTRSPKKRRGGRAQKAEKFPPRDITRARDLNRDGLGVRTPTSIEQGEATRLSPQQPDKAAGTHPTSWSQSVQGKNYQCKQSKRIPLKVDKE